MRKYKENKIVVVLGGDVAIFCLISGDVAKFRVICIGTCLDELGWRVSSLRLLNFGSRVCLFACFFPYASLLALSI